MDVIFYLTLGMAARSNRATRGYTLTELMTTLAVTAVVLAMAVPSFSTLIQHNRLTTSINTLASVLHYTRSEAIKRNNTIVLCKGTPDSGCVSSRAWHDGWIVFPDYDRDKVWSEDEPLLWTQAELAPGQMLTWNAFPSSNYLVYYPSGTASSNGTFTFCDQRGTTAAKALIVSKSGRVRLSRRAANGSALHCAQ